MKKQFLVPVVIPQGRMATNPKCERWNVIRADGTYAGCVVSWTFGYMAYNADHEQLTNSATKDAAVDVVLNPPAIYVPENSITIRA